MNRFIKGAKAALVALALSALVSTGGLQAALLSVTAGGVIIPAPSSVLPNPFGATGDLQQGFDELQNVTLGAPLSTDLGILPAGLTVSSHMIFLNPASGIGSSANPTWTFDGIVIGVMSDINGALEVASTPILGNPVTTYPGAPFLTRGLEPIDGYLFIGNQLTSKMVVFGGDKGDWIRVVTLGVAVPEPSTYLLFGSFLAMAVFLKRRKAVSAENC